MALHAAVLEISAKTHGKGGPNSPGPARVNPVPGGLRRARNRAGILFAPPPRQISKTTNRSDKRQTAFDTSLTRAVLGGRFYAPLKI